MRGLNDIETKKTWIIGVKAILILSIKGWIMFVNRRKIK